jgi:cholesterol transport system auxiliary component
LKNLITIVAVVGAIVGAVSACNPLKPAADQPLTFHTLSLSAPSALERPATFAGNDIAKLPTVILNPTHAAAGFETAKLIYLRQKHQIEYYAQSEWVAPPARMLSPLIVERLARTGRFKAVVLTPSAVRADLRLNTEIIRLQHEFMDASAPSKVRFTLRSHIMDEKTRKVLASTEFEAVVDAPSENAVGGVIGANLALQLVLDDLATMTVKALSTP